MRLLSCLWNRQHYSGTIVYRPAFMRDMACGGPYFSKMLLNAIYFAMFGFLTPPQRGGYEDGEPFRRRFEEHLHRDRAAALWKSEVTTIQALLVVSEALFTWCDERSIAWHYMGIAVTMIVDLGIHVEGPTFHFLKSHSLADMEARRRLFWAAFGK